MNFAIVGFLVLGVSAFLPACFGTVLMNMFDVRYWRCVLKKSSSCPDSDIKFFLYTHENPYRKIIDLRNPASLKYSGWDPGKKNVIIIHGFNGTESKVPMTFIRAAYVKRGDYNVFMVDWEPLTLFPCYLSALSNTRLVAQCTAQLYSYLTDQGALARKTHCVGHSLGAHICGMMSNHLSIKMHKIIGLDPARPLVDRYGNRSFRLTRDDATQVQVLHTNAGALGEESQVGHIDFCINGGRSQPGCKGHRLQNGTRISPSRGRRARCSHFQSACYFAATIAGKKKHLGVPCTPSCPKRGRSLGLLSGPSVAMGEATPEGASGHYCVTIKNSLECPFD